MQKTLGVLSIAAILTLLNVGPAASQTKVVTKVLLDNANVSVRQTTYPPGAVNTPRGPARVIYIVKGPQRFKRTTADGHTSILAHQTGDAYWLPAGKATVTNVGPNTTVTLAIFVKK